MTDENPQQPFGEAEYRRRQRVRANLMGWILGGLAFLFFFITMARMGRILQGIPTKDLYYLKSICSRAKSFSKKFWWEIDPKKHVVENPF